jgi:hypothetical protein
MIKQEAEKAYGGRKELKNLNEMRNYPGNYHQREKKS